MVEGLPERYDVITTFDVVHDAVDPIGLFRAVRKALKDDGSYIVLEIACSDRLEENLGPLGTVKIWDQPVLLHDFFPGRRRRRSGHHGPAGTQVTGNDGCRRLQQRPPCLARQFQHPLRGHSLAVSGETYIV